MKPIWKEAGGHYPRLEEDVHCSAAVVGGGLTGVILAYLLAERGMDTVLFEENTIASGKTGRSTAKVTLAHGFRYAEMAEKISPEAARKYAAANLAGFRFYEEHLPGVRRQEMFLYALYGERRLRREFHAMTENGIRAEYVAGDAVPLPFPVAGAIRLPDQFAMDPVAFAEDLCRRGNFTVYENSPVTEVTGHSLTCAGHRVEAEHVIVCTNYPRGVPGSMAPVKLSRKSSCAVRMRQEGGFDFPRVMAFGADGGYGYRFGSGACAEDLLVSGETSRGAPSPNAVQRMVETVRTFAPRAEVVENWVNNDTYTHDGIPYAGQLSSGVWIACGYGAWGMTNAASAAVLLADGICGRECWYGDVFSPKRNFLKGGSAEFTEHLSTAVGGGMKRLSQPPKKNARDLVPGEAAVVNVSGKRMGAYRDEEGEVHLVNLRCPHLGCEMEWNGEEKTWDCPCHGSRFRYTGECLSHPAEGCVRAE